MDNVAVKIALPGQAGQSFDFLDLFLSGGAGAVVECLEAGDSFQPTQDELDKYRGVQRETDDIKKIATVFPLPEIEGLELVYRRSEIDRKVKVYQVSKSKHKAEAGEDTAPVLKPLFTPFSVPRRLCYADREEAYGLRVVVQDMNGRPRSVDFERADLAKMGASDIKAALFAAGHRTYPCGESIAVQILKAADPANEVLVVSKAGWHRRPDKAAYYMTPGGQAIGRGDQVGTEMAAGIAIEMAVAGTMPLQIGAIDAALRAQNTPHWHLGAASGGVGILIDLIGDDSCGLCLSGTSSVGKTIAQRMGASWWGSPKMGDGLLKPLKATGNALEALAQSANGSFLGLDELGHADPKAVPSMVYLLAANQGRARLNKNIVQRQPFRWRTFGLLSSETGLRSKVEAGGGTWMAGMSVRVPDIKVTDVNGAPYPRRLFRLWRRV